MQKVKRYIATLLLAVFTFVLVPKEAFHSLTGHEDNVDVYKGYATVGTKHIHCHILQFQFAGFTQPHSAFIPSNIVFSSLLISAGPSAISIDVADNLRARAPP